MKDENREALLALGYSSFLFIGVGVWFYFSLDFFDIVILLVVFFTLIASISFAVGLTDYKNNNFQFLFFPVFLWFYYWSYFKQSFLIGYWLIIAVCLIFIATKSIFFILSERKKKKSRTPTN